jgi:predicted RNA-binding Zn ribbon-like protein
MQLVGGHLAVDFVNTVGGLRDAGPDPNDDALETYDDLVEWSERVGTLSQREAASLADAGRERSAEARRVVRRAVKLRELVYDVLRAVADGREPDPELLERLRAAEREALAHARLELRDGRLEFVWPLTDDLVAPLWPVTHAAIDLLTHGPVERLKVCANCRWLFLDESRNRSRRWCSMDECGVQIKTQRFVERRRSRRG